jgi:nitrogen PTS system EIIA component
MTLKVKDAAKLLSVSEKTIYRWVSQGIIPAYRVNDQYRFNRAELLEWATAQRIAISPKILEEPDGGETTSLEKSLRAGGVFHFVGGTDKSSALKSVVSVMPLPEEVDRDFLLQVLLARESVGSTGVGDGIAIPHVRNPVVLHVSRPMVTLSFLENQIDFGAIDGKPVHTLFTIVSPTIRSHLNLLARLVYGLRDSGFSQALSRRASGEDILTQARLLDERMAAQERSEGGAE